MTTRDVLNKIERLASRASPWLDDRVLWACLAGFFVGYLMRDKLPPREGRGMGFFHGRRAFLSRCSCA
jgi:hypothetical protein